MAKIRVYELAKDLNMTNRELLKKLAELEIEISNHMSSLDDESVKKIKFSLFGNLDKKVDERRIHPTVIRRRKKSEKIKKGILSKPLNNDPNNFEICESRTNSGSKAENKEISIKIDSPNINSVSNLNNIAKQMNKKKKEAAKIISKPSVKSPLNNKSVLSSNRRNISNKENFPVENPIKNNKGEKNITNSKVSMITEEPKNSSLNNGNHDNNVSPEDHKNKSKFKNKKSIFTRNIKKKDTPAKIIKKANPPKIEQQKNKVDRPSENLVSDNKYSETDKAKTSEQSKRKSYKKKKVFKKREIIEGKELYSGKKKGKKNRRRGNRFKPSSTGQKTQITIAKAIKRRIKIDETIILSELAKRLGIKANEMIAKLMSMGLMVTVNQTIDFETACLVANEFSYEIEKASFEEDIILKKIDDDPKKLIQRPPVVTIMGHVDHGKTSLLDTIRKTRVTEGEVGGITQHIGAYHVKTEKGVIAFLDTPGHEAFSAMRSRGAQITDLVVLVVAADDGVMPQTVEAINHSKASNVPILVAINKMDKLDASPDRVLRELSEHGLVPEEWGGEVVSVEVSAKQNQGINVLLEMILLQAEMLDLKANPDKFARGYVVESKLDSGRGSVATILVQDGTLKLGDSVICGMYYGKIRAIQDDMGQKVTSAGPSMPVEIIGLSGVPMAGDELVALKDEKDAKQVSMHRTQKQRSKELAKSSKLSLEGLFERMQKGEIKDLNIIIKADVDGSLEALRDSLLKLSNNEVNIHIVHSATGTISESDISLAAVSNAIIIGFNVRPNAKTQDFASEEQVDTRFYNIIYDVIKDVKNAIVGMMDSTYKEHLLGRANVREVFHVPKIGTIAGCYVTDGKILRGKLVRLIRDGVVVYTGKNSSLRRFKDDVKEVQGGYECGIGIENFNDIKIGDVIEVYYMEEIKPKID